MYMSSKVYFVDFRARSAKDNKITKIADLFDAAGFNGILGRDMLTAIKVHFGEEGNDTLFAQHDPYSDDHTVDYVFGGAGNDTIYIASGDQAHAGEGNDTIAVSATGATQIRMTFTSANVGNGMGTGTAADAANTWAIFLRRALMEGGISAEIHGEEEKSLWTTLAATTPAREEAAP